MSVRIKCPECRAVNRIDESDIGTRIRCKECDERFRVLKDDVMTDEGVRARKEDSADDDADDQPRRKKKKKAGSNTMLLIGILGGGGVLLIAAACLVGIGFIWLVRKGGEPDPIPMGHGNVVLDKREQLVASDPRDPLHPAAHMKVHQIQMQAGKTYHIFLNSNDFDAFLRLEAPNGQNLAEDDDGGNGLNSLIIHRATQTGLHRIIATSLGSGTGRYHLNVQESGQPDPIPKGGNPNPKEAAARVVLDKDDQLTKNDPRDPRRKAANMKIHLVQMQAGKNYRISLNSAAFDAYLRLESPAGKQLAEDDDGGGGLNSLIVHRATATGMHRVIATSLGGGTGPYHLNVQETD